MPTLVLISRAPKGRYQTHGGNSVNSQLFFKIFSLSDSPVNLGKALIKDPTTHHMRPYITQ